MDKICPGEVIRHIYKYDPTYKKKHVDKVLKQMMAHCFIYNCHKCFRPWNNLIAIVKCVKLILNTANKYVTMK